jgi:hypothetical protein
VKGLTIFKGLLLTTVVAVTLLSSVWFLQPSAAEPGPASKEQWLRDAARERIRELAGEFRQDLRERYARLQNDCEDEQETVQVATALAEAADEALAVAEQALYYCLEGGGGGGGSGSHLDAN